MIVFDLKCDANHRFESWFASSAGFEEQRAGGLILCPVCSSDKIEKAPMAPSVPAKGNAIPAEPMERSVSSAQRTRDDANASANTPQMAPAVARALKTIEKLQTEQLKQSEWVGSNFAECSRMMHYGESNAKPIHGQASIEDARDLAEEGIAVMPLLIPVVPPDDVN